MKAWQFLLFLFVVSSTNSLAQTRIHIEDSSYAHIPLRFYGYETLATHTPKLLKTETVDSTGKLSVEIPLEEAQLLYIPVYSFRLVFYAEPNTEITLKIPSLEKLKQAFAQLKSYSGREIPLFIMQKSSLNQAIAHYDNAYNKFLKTNFQSLYLKKNAAGYQEKIRKLHSLHKSEYFQQYADYKEGYLHYVAGEQENLGKNYFANKPLLLHNTAYVSLTRKLAAPLATDIAKAPKYSPLYKKIRTAKTYTRLRATFKDIGGTNDAEFNEHFFCYVLQAGILQKTIPTKTALAKLKLIAQSSANTSNKKLASSITSQQEKRFAGSNVPKFSLQATNDKIYTEAIFKSTKPGLLAFFDSAQDNTESIRTLQELQEKYANSFQVFAFSSEKELLQLPENWLQFVVPYYSYVLQDYHLGRFPYYVLVDEQGKISQQTWQQYLMGLEK